jgi:hypothetical protein
MRRYETKWVEFILTSLHSLHLISIEYCFEYLICVLCTAEFLALILGSEMVTGVYNDFLEPRQKSI